MAQVTLKLTRKEIDAAIIEAAEHEISTTYRRELTGIQVYYYYDDNAEIDYVEYVADVKKGGE